MTPSPVTMPVSKATEQLPCEVDDSERTPTLRATAGYAWLPSIREEEGRADNEVYEGEPEDLSNRERAELIAHGVEEIDHAILRAMDMKLARRPSLEEVQAKGLLKSSVAATGESLVRRSLFKHLDVALERRPSREILIEQGIIASPAAPQEASKPSMALWPEWVFDSAHIERMNAAIERRPSAAELIDKGVLKNAVDTTKEGLQRRSRSNSLDAALEKRPSIGLLVDVCQPQRNSHRLDRMAQCSRRRCSLRMVSYAAAPDISVARKRRLLFSHARLYPAAATARDRAATGRP